MFIEVTPTGKDYNIDPPVTINFNDVRSFYYDAQIGATILRFFDESRANLPVVEDLRAIQRALDHVGNFASARKLQKESERRSDQEPDVGLLNSAS